MKTEPVVIVHPKYTILGILSACTVGLMITLSFIYIGIRYPDMRLWMFIDFALVWAIIVGWCIMERQVRILQTTVNALTNYIKVKKNVRPI